MPLLIFVNKGIEIGTHALTLEIIADTCGADVAKAATFIVCTFIFHIIETTFNDLSRNMCLSQDRPSRKKVRGNIKIKRHTCNCLSQLSSGSQHLSLSRLLRKRRQTRLPYFSINRIFDGEYSSGPLHPVRLTGHQVILAPIL